MTSGFSLPGFDGVLRAFRVYRPESDSTKPTGWKFTKDGTPLWPDLDGRPALEGTARTPSDPDARNIYTYIPDGSTGAPGANLEAFGDPDDFNNGVGQVGVRILSWREIR